MIPTLAILCLLTLSTLSMAFDEHFVEAAEPEYLDALLKEERYEEFNRLMGIDIPHLSMPSGNESRDPRFSEHLEHGDILLRPWQKEQARQGINFTKYKSMEWKSVPYNISTNFTPTEKETIQKGISEFNSCVGDCILWKPRTNESSYVFIFPGSGCYSNLGCVGKQQPLSLDKNGCIYVGTILHEMKHAIGFIHEQCRPDRDDHIIVYTNNINPDWRSQYDKFSASDIVIAGPYDYYSIMHYPQRHRDVSGDSPAYDVKNSTIIVSKMGYAQRFTDTDIFKIKKLYCKK